MKQVINLTSTLKCYDLDSFDADARREAVHLAPGESVSLKDGAVNSRQLVAALSKGEIAVKELKADKKVESSESSKSEKKTTNKPKDKENK